MTYRQQYEELLYQYEILLARLSVREYFLKTVVREVYENIGQVLSLIRVQLSTLQPGYTAGSSDNISSSGELVGQTIRELRTMCRLFYPEENILSRQGLPDAIQTAIKNLYPDAACDLSKEETVFAGWNEDRLLLLYSIVLELLELIHRQQNAMLNTALMHLRENCLLFLFEYSGEAIRKPAHAARKALLNLSVFDRAELLGGKLEIKKTGTVTRRIKLALPIQ